MCSQLVVHWKVPSIGGFCQVAGAEKLAGLKGVLRGPPRAVSRTQSSESGSVACTLKEIVWPATTQNSLGACTMGGLFWH